VKTSIIDPEVWWSRSARMLHLTIEILEGALSSLRRTRHISYELFIWLQPSAAEISGMSRSAWITALGQFGVLPFQDEAEEIVETAECA
jgi:hypothetical protein